MLVRMTGVEPARRRRQILSLVRLPISPFPQAFIRLKPKNKVGILLDYSLKFSKITHNCLKLYANPLFNRIC